MSAAAWVDLALRGWILATAIACAGPALAQPASTPARPATEGIQKQEIEGVRNFSRVDATVACGGATTPEAFGILAGMGFRSVINLREAGEPGADIDAGRAAALAAGLRYLHLPFNSTRPSPAIVESFLAAVTDPGNQPVYIHCASANRVGALWYVKRVGVDGWDRDVALAEAEAIGLTSPSLRQFADDFLALKGK